MVNQQQPEDGASQQAPLSPQGVARRRFTKAGAAASGVLLTLHSTSGLAGGGMGGATVCTNSSAGASAGVTSNRRTQVAGTTCEGAGPVTWADSHTAWPSGCSRGTQFGSVFPCSGTTASTSMLTYVKGTSGADATQLCMYLTCAYLNVISLKSTFNTVAELQRMWNEYRLNSYYSPSAGVKWDAAAIVRYLASTMRYS